MACNFHIAQICPVMYCIVLSCPVLSDVQLRLHNRQLAGESRNKAEAALCTAVVQDERNKRGIL